ncbi:MAG: ATP-binding cassette domain-containing protein [Proteobacteria bacterium]|nr:ATP-binding cassette domain-containing protein [Pseudomonadota bacterium]NIS69247.1 ATP-binding cassette domain-containing protein [Pseudomonadota bacterium]
MRSDTVVELKGITKAFPGVVANKDIDFELNRGEVHALLGENGAGKTTLMNILSGLLRPDDGEIRIFGKPVSFRSPREAISLGIGMVHQQFLLVPSLSVVENIVLGHKEEGFIPNLRNVEKKIKTLSENYNLEIEPRAKVWQLSAGEKQRVEILKALYREAQVLILDEPTSVLAPQEAEGLINALREMTSEGHLSVVFVSHKLPEVTAVSDRITVLRRGRVVAAMENDNVDYAVLSNVMVGRELQKSVSPRRREKGGILLEVEDLVVPDDRGVPAVDGVSFTLSEGEILGIAGVAGNGQKELGEALIGLRSATRGRVIFCGKEITDITPRQAIEKKIGFIPEEPLTIGLAGGLSVADNLILDTYRSSRFLRKGLLDYNKIEGFSRGIVDTHGIKTPDLGLQVGHLSGGNVQRLILGRELSRDLKLLVANHPTKGLDVGAADFVWEKLISLGEEGVGIILISEDLEEIQTLSNRIAVMYEGELVGVEESGRVDRKKIGLLMMGVGKEE